MPHQRTVRQARAAPGSAGRTSTALPAQALPAVQARSSLTVARLLSAAEAVVERDGIDGATVPAIARQARMSVGVVYRRFADKDALLRALYQRHFKQVEFSLARVADTLQGRDMPLAELARCTISGWIHGVRAKGALQRALLVYAQSHPDDAFRRRAAAMQRRAFQQLAALFLARKREIAHPDPETAVRFGLTAIAFTLRATLLERSAGRAYALPEDRLGEELSRMFLGYLGTGTARARTQS